MKFLEENRKFMTSLSDHPLVECVTNSSGYYLISDPCTNEIVSSKKYETSNFGDLSLAELSKSQPTSKILIYPSNDDLYWTDDNIVMYNPYTFEIIKPKTYLKLAILRLNPMELECEVAKRHTKHDRYKLLLLWNQ